MTRFLLLLGVGLLVLCAAGQSTASATQSESLALQLSKSPYVQELTSIVGEMTTRARDRGVTIEEVSRAYENRDESAIADLLGYSEADIQALSERLNDLRESIYAEFPEIEQLAEAQAQNGSCDPAVFAQLFGNDAGDQIYLAAPPPGTTCAWVPYTAALVVCTALGPVLYWACATVALCTFCSGGLVDVICGGTPHQE
jgi:hypothetical protein